MRGMNIDAATVRRWRVESEGGEPAVLAAAEFRTGQPAAGTGEPPASPGERDGAIVFRLEREAGSPGFIVEAGPERLVIAGATLRDLLDGAAWLRRELGMLAPGPGREAAGPAEGRFPFGRRAFRGAFRERGLVLGCDGLHEQWREWFAFASRNGLNTVFLHDTPPSTWDRLLDVRVGRLFDLWDREGPAIAAEARRLGLQLEFGGHHLSTLIPRAAFEEHPEWFPERGGERTEDFNLCVSNAGARQALQEGARRFFARFAGCDVYHLWADDLRWGGWCECDGCAELTPSDQALLATNLVAEVLAEVAPGARIAHLAYHDTITPPTQVEPRANVDALWAPRNRCYAHALDDETCRRNLRHSMELRGLIAWFGGPERVRAFEYYSDGILFKWMAPPHLGVLPRDAAAYRELGIGGLLDLAVSPRPWWGPNWHAWWFARCAWDGDGDAEEALATFCRANFGEHAAAFAEAYRRLETACLQLLERGNLEPMRLGDVLDYNDDPFEELRELAGRAGRALAEFAAAVQALPIAVDGAGLEAVEELAPTVAAGMHLAERVIGWDTVFQGDHAEAMAHVRMADVHLRALGDWYHAHGGPAWSTLAELMLRSARWHTNRVRAMAGGEWNPVP
jgi:hypothetical protein